MGTAVRLFTGAFACLNLVASAWWYFRAWVHGDGTVTELLELDPNFAMGLNAGIFAGGVFLALGLIWIAVVPPLASAWRAWSKARKHKKSVAYMRLRSAAFNLASGKYRNKSVKAQAERDVDLRIVANAGLAPEDTSLKNWVYWHQLLPHVEEGMAEAKRWHRQFHKRRRT